MKIDAAAVRTCLKAFDFKKLFREYLGWDNHQAGLDVSVDGSAIGLKAVAEKRGFVAFVCPTIPDRPTRLKIDHQVTKFVREHFIIYVDQSAGQQVWHWVRREPGKPLASRDHRFDASQSGDPLIQRLDQIAVSLDEEEKITVVDVAGRARAAFDVDKVTKKFYDRFKAEHSAFLKLIKGIESDADLQWYSSLMLNRLMFVYFIQKKGFLDGDRDYLRNRLARVREIKGKDKFHSFYRYFLLRLFHDGLGKSPDERTLDAAMEKLLGKVPFLNGGFFEVHELEERWDAIDIPDKAFEKLFDFFDQYSWHLDERPLRADNEINPDVVGYIFEKFVNQKQMGAYYTKEDITEYISKNTVIPFLLDAAKKKCAVAFKPDSALWRLLRDDPDRYIYQAVRKGVIDEKGNVIPLPKEIEAGVTNVSKRDGWNRAATDPYALPTETWREHVARRQRCLEIREKLRNGEVHEVNDLITLNLDIWQFARDAIINCEGPELLRAFWHAIEKVTVLDPTCGSGAFLFAALRILESLYSDCLERMERFVEDLAGKKHHPEQFNDFKKVLTEIARHPSERYFILKSIIINNLFGVDIMEEAVEICKLRLFLKLVAQVEKVEQIEPLPDIDFNIRTGNTLVGYVCLEQVRKSQEDTLGFGASEVKRIEEEADLVERAFTQFRAQQTTHGGRVTHRDKHELRRRMEKLTAQLNRFLAGEYGVNLGKPKELQAWEASHQPFHWFAEFYGIMRAGGFDVIIGNPPYVETSIVNKYSVRGFKTIDCGNLYPMCVERAVALLSQHGQFSFIVPSGGFSTGRMRTYQDLVAENFQTLHISYFSGDAHPSVLFQGVKYRICILLGSRKGSTRSAYTTQYMRWYAEERVFLFPRIRYEVCEFERGYLRFAKLGLPLARNVLRKLLSTENLGAFLRRSGEGHVTYHRSPVFWIRSMDFEPYFRSATKSRSTDHLKDLYFENQDHACRAAGMLNSTCFYFWFTVQGNCRDIAGPDIEGFPTGDLASADLAGLPNAFAALMADLRKHSVTRVYNYKHSGRVEYQEFYPARSKLVVDEIDRVLAKHYGFTDEELDFIINYDIKYRMGADADGDDEE